MSFSKKIRQIVHQKYDGHCAYCGRVITLAEMQVDHFISQSREAHFIRGEIEGMDSVDDIKNLMPSCRTCNHYKRANDLETFRRYIEEIPRKMRKNYIYKVGVLYGSIIENVHPVKFYFEQVEDGLPY